MVLFFVSERKGDKLDDPEPVTPSKLSQTKEATDIKVDDQKDKNKQEISTAKVSQLKDQQNRLHQDSVSEKQNAKHLNLKLPSQEKGIKGVVPVPQESTKSTDLLEKLELEKDQKDIQLLSAQNKVSEEIVSKPKARVESSSSSSDSTLRQSYVTQLISTTISEAETLKQVQTPESETFDSGAHFHRIQAVEPLVQVNEPRFLEEVIPYVIKPPPELVPGSAIDKLYSVETSGVSEIVLTDFQVGVEVNVEVDSEMSRRYTSSAG